MSPVCAALIIKTWGTKKSCMQHCKITDFQIQLAPVLLKNSYEAHEKSMDLYRISSKHKLTNSHVADVSTPSIKTPRAFWLELSVKEPHGLVRRNRAHSANSSNLSRFALQASETSETSRSRLRTTPRTNQLNRSSNSKLVEICKPPQHFRRPLRRTTVSSPPPAHPWEQPSRTLHRKATGRPPHRSNPLPPPPGLPPRRRGG